MKKKNPDILHITSINTIGIYLGCSNIDKYKKRTKSDFEVMKQRAGHKLANWTDQTLSTASKIVLIKFNLTLSHQYSFTDSKF